MILFSRPVANYVTSTVETVLALHREERNGDILAFLTGQEEVETAVNQLKWVWSTYICIVTCTVCVMAYIREHAERGSKGMQLTAVPLYGGLPYGEQVCMYIHTCIYTHMYYIHNIHY